MNRAQIIKSLTPQETILNVLQGQRVELSRKLNWVAGDEWEEVKADLESVDRALAFAYKLHLST
jgi:hypothetical protein